MVEKNSEKSGIAETLIFLSPVIKFRVQNLVFVSEPWASRRPAARKFLV
jgi:hypothetical protein